MNILILIFTAVIFSSASTTLTNLKNEVEKILGGRIDIFPGTNWCGKGNNPHTGLGFFREEDKCCRTHDLCPELIPAYQSDYNLTNPTFITRLSCDCDKEFYDCLKQVGSIISSKIGIIYFNLLGTQCFKEDHPIKRCAKFYFLSNKCKRYELDTTQDKVYQFFDVPKYLL